MRSKIPGLALTLALGSSLPAQPPAPSAASAPPTTSARPSIVFLLTDDQRYDAMGCAGNPQLKTPAMDRIAAEGVRFRNAFVTHSLCSPSRASFLTSRYSSLHGVINNGTDLPDSTLTFPQLLQKAGYATGYCGKWHMGSKRSDRRPGFDFMASYKGQGVYNDPPIEVNGKQFTAKGWTDDIMTDHALEFLRGVPKGKPFYLQVSFKACHGPFLPPERLKGFYQDVVFPLGPGLADDLSAKPRWQQGGSRWSVSAKEDGKDPAAWLQDFMREYHADLVGADENAGRVLKFLDENGLAENTIIVFCGDNGFFHGEHDHLDKRLMYEESIRIPLLVRLPLKSASAAATSAPPVAPEGAKGGRILDPMILNIDLAPTLLDYAGVEIPKEFQGRSFRPWLEGKNPADWRTSWYYEYFESHKELVPIEGVRTTTQKYCRTMGAEPAEEEMYDLGKDPHEMTNLAAIPIMKDAKAELVAEMERLKKELGIPGVKVAPKGNEGQPRKKRR